MSLSLHDYLKWRGDLSFDQIPFNEVDAFVFSSLAYYPWKGTVRKTFTASPVLLKDAIPKMDWDSDTMSYIDWDKKLAELVAGSNRFGNVSAIGFVNEIDKERSTQFSAISFCFGPKQNFIAFRGTDSTIAGWRENMDLAYEDQVPAQKKAIIYLNNAAAELKGNLYVGGHSKGGNLAVYSSAFTKSTIKRRILDVYNFDGPGFNEVVIKNDNFKNIASKVHTFVPQDSLIGTLLEHKEKITVIHSSEHGGAKQHYMDSWEVGPLSLVRETGLSRSGEFSHDNLSQWINGLSFEEKREFIDMLFGLAEKHNIETVDELFSPKVFLSLLAEYKKLDDEHKSTIKNPISDLESTFWENFKSKCVEPISGAAENIKSKTVKKASRYLKSLEERHDN